MTKITSLADLKKLKADLKSKIELREKSDSPEGRIQVKVAMATCGIAAGAKVIMEYMLEELDKRGVDAIVSQTGCLGYCFAEPTVEVVIPGNEPVVFGYVDSKKANEIIEKYIKNGELLDGIIPVNYQKID
ncbi:MAG TPA: NADP oxidoreductase [Bacteroidales bacterium]|nr:NADP oxidoreductase [Bacteroidales bacterium]